MNNRIHKKLDELRSKNRKALSIFITAGYPTIDATPDIVGILEESGADIIELGIPYSDPLADGPTIQHSSDIALRNGVTLTTVFETVDRIRDKSNIPVVLMGYVNPLISYGIERFMETTSQKGVDGLIIPDLPVEESDEYRSLAIQHNLAPVFLAAPTTSDTRLKQIDDISEGFVYCVSITGVTGQTNGLPENVRDYLQRCKSNITRNPVLVGFGISSGDDARKLAPYSDGIIIGSSLIKKINDAHDGNIFSDISIFIKELREGLDNPPDLSEK